VAKKGKMEKKKLVFSTQTKARLMSKHFALLPPGSEAV
jgi:hypothetical protein